MLWSFVTCCSFSARLSACVDLFFDRLWLDSTGFEDSSCYDDSQDADFGLSFFFIVLPFFKCNVIAYALHLRGGVLRSISIGLGL
jgi:hypothetical protein